jgi:hypothetical protein
MHRSDAKHTGGKVGCDKFSSLRGALIDIVKVLMVMSLSLLNLDFFSFTYSRLV